MSRDGLNEGTLRPAGHAGYGQARKRRMAAIERHCTAPAALQEIPGKHYGGPDSCKSG